MKLCSKLSFVVFLAIFFACGKSDETPLLILSATYDFNESEHGWVHGFADYPAGPDDSTLFELKYAYTDQPAGNMFTRKSVMLSGKNFSQDLFMYLKKRIPGLKPNTEYTITFNVDLACELNADLILASGSSKSVYLKAGATNSEPKRVIDGGYYVMNIDKGDQSTAGEDMTLLGDIVTPQNSVGYTLITRNNTTITNSSYVAKSSSNGELWLIIGTDSGFEGTTTLYYTRINVVFSAS